jgi:hypothetical protein
MRPPRETLTRHEIAQAIVDAVFFEGIAEDIEKDFESRPLDPALQR